MVASLEIASLSCVHPPLVLQHANKKSRRLVRLQNKRHLGATISADQPAANKTVEEKGGRSVAMLDPLKRGSNRPST